MLAIPGLGPVVAAGWLASTLVGAGIGAAAGGLTGSLTDVGVSHEDAYAYAEGVRRGGYPRYGQGRRKPDLSGDRDLGPKWNDRLRRALPKLGERTAGPVLRLMRQG